MAVPPRSMVTTRQYQGYGGALSASRPLRETWSLDADGHRLAARNGEHDSRFASCVGTRSFVIYRTSRRDVSLRERVSLTLCLCMSVCVCVVVECQPRVK